MSDPGDWLDIGGADLFRDVVVLRASSVVLLAVIVAVPFTWTVVAEPTKDNASIAGEQNADRLSHRNQALHDGPQSVAPAHGRESERAIAWPGHSAERIYIAIDHVDATTPHQFDSIVFTPVASLSVAGSVAVRTGASAVQATWTVAVPTVAQTSGGSVWFAVAGGAPTASAPQGSPVSLTSTTLPGGTPQPASVGSPSTALSVPASVAEFFGRVPQEWSTRPPHILRALRRGLSWIAVLTLRNRRILDQDTRCRVYEFLVENPGALAGHIADRLGVRRQTILYHLRILMREGRVVSRANGRRHYFRRDDPQRADSRHVLSPGTRSILEVLPEQPVTAQELAERLGLSRRTIHWHLGRLCDHGLVEGLRSRAGTRYVRSS